MLCCLPTPPCGSPEIRGLHSSPHSRPRIPESSKGSIRGPGGDPRRWEHHCSEGGRQQVSAAASSRPGRAGAQAPRGRVVLQNSVRTRPGASRCLGQGPTETQRSTSLDTSLFCPFPHQSRLPVASYFTVAAFNSHFMNSEQETAARGKALTSMRRAPQIQGPTEQTICEPLWPPETPNPTRQDT